MRSTTGCYTRRVLREVQLIPPAPRRVRWRKVLGYRWPLAAATFALSVYGGVITWLFFLANSFLFVEADRLENSTRVPVDAVVRAVTDGDRGDAKVQRIDYEFYSEGHVFTGSCRVVDGAFREGMSVPIEYAAGNPNLSRVRDARIEVRARRFDPSNSFALLVVPGLLLGIAWLAGVMRLRSVLMHGDVGVATIVDVRRVRFCLPESLSVKFCFKDRRAVERTSRHWVRLHSPLGERLLAMQAEARVDKLPVLHDRRVPQHCRLVLPADFGGDLAPVDANALPRL